MWKKEYYKWRSKKLEERMIGRKERNGEWLDENENNETSLKFPYFNDEKWENILCRALYNK